MDEDAAPVDLEALLVGLADNQLAWMANRMSDAPPGHRWRSRDAAEAAILLAAETLPDDDPRRELPWRWQRDVPTARRAAP